MSDTKRDIFAERDALKAEVEALHSAMKADVACKEVLKTISAAQEPLTNTDQSRWSNHGEEGMCDKCVIL